MRITVTGGAGFIGANLCRELLRRRHEVVVLDDLSTGNQSNVDGLEVELVQGSVLSPGAVLAACQGADSVVHLAGLGSVPRSLEDPLLSHHANTTGTLTVLDAARQTGSHVIVASSSAVYGRNPALPRSEELVCQPTSPYGVSKLAAESYAMAYRDSYGLDTLAFRLFNVYGPLQPAGSDYAAVLPRFIRAALLGEPISVHGDGEQSRDFTYVDTVVEVLAIAAEGRVSSTAPVNLAFGTRASVNDVIRLLSEELGRPLETVREPGRPGDVRHSEASGTALRQLFPTVRPVPLEVGLRRTLAWLTPIVQHELTLSGRPA